MKDLEGKKVRVVYTDDKDITQCFEGEITLIDCELCHIHIDEKHVKESSKVRGLKKTREQLQKELQFLFEDREDYEAAQIALIHAITIVDKMIEVHS